MSAPAIFNIKPKTKALTEKRRHPLTPWEKKALDTITEVVLEAHEKTPEYFDEYYRKDHISQVRFVMMWFAYEKLFISPTKIAVYYGFRQHNTVNYACESVNNQRGYDKNYAERVGYICIKLSKLKQPKPPRQLRVDFN